MTSLHTHRPGGVVMAPDNLPELIRRLRVGVPMKPSRWSGDTHADDGGEYEIEQADALMAEAADVLVELRALDACRRCDTCARGFVNPRYHAAEVGVRCDWLVGQVYFKPDHFCAKWKAKP